MVAGTAFDTSSNVGVSDKGEDGGSLTTGSTSISSVEGAVEVTFSGRFSESLDPFPARPRWFSPGTMGSVEVLSTFSHGGAADLTGLGSPLTSRRTTTTFFEGCSSESSSSRRFRFAVVGTRLRCSEGKDDRGLNRTVDSWGIGNLLTGEGIREGC